MRWLKETIAQFRGVPFRSPIQRKKIVVLGAGWGGFGFIHTVKRLRYDLTVISPRNHFLFTPLLASTTVGTLEFRCVTEPIRTVKNLDYHQAHCMDIDTEKRELVCRDYWNMKEFREPYDVLVVGCGAKSNTFGIKGVEEHCYFLKQLSDARAIRKRILQNFEEADSPATKSEEEMKKLVTVCIVGAGPTGVEFAAELHDFLVSDVVQLYPNLHDAIQINLIEAADTILGMFSANLAKYTTDLYRKRNINVMTGTAVNEVSKDSITLSDGKVIPCGLVVWNTGNANIDLVNKLDWAKDKRSGRILVNGHQSVLGANGDKEKPLENVFAIGDCAVDPDNPLPPTAQVASQKGIWLAKALTKSDCVFEDFMMEKPFEYGHRGTLAILGGGKAIADLDKFMSKGRNAWLVWHSVYFTQLMSWKNRMLVPMHWLKSSVFGRDISQF